MALTGKGVTTPTPGTGPWSFSGDKKQDPVIHPGGCDGPTPALTCGANCEHNACILRLRVSCGGWACTARAEAKLTGIKNDKLRPRSIDVRPHPEWWKRLDLEVPLKTRLQAGKALAEGKKVVAKVSVRATDAAGNVTTAKRTISIVK